MKKQMFGLAVAAFAIFGLSACSGSAAPAETSDQPAAVVETAPAESAAPAAEASGQTVQEACLAMAGPLATASTAMAESAQASVTDPQTAVAAWTDLASGFETIATDTQNAEVKAAATTAHADIAAVRDAMQKVFVDQDMTAMGDYTSATQRMSDSYSALLQLCQ